MDSSKVDNRLGIVKVLNQGTFVAVVGDNWWRAKEALKDVAIEWDTGDNAKLSSASIMASFKEGLDQPQLAVARNDGNAPDVLAKASKVHEAEYFTPYLAHATMEPLVCTAWMHDGKVEVWTSTQNPEGVLIAKAMAGKPVKMVWTREEDTQHDLYRPASLVRMKASVDDAGKVQALHIRVSAPSILATLLKLPLPNGIDGQAVASFNDHPYNIPNSLVDYAQRNTNVPVGFWRTVGHSQNPFVRESFIDELAHAAGKDPLAFRQSLLGEKFVKDRAILEAVAKAADWGKPLPKGVFRGIAEIEGYGSYTACV